MLGHPKYIKTKQTFHEKQNWNKFCHWLFWFLIRSRGPVTYREFGYTCSVESTDNSLHALEQRVQEACALVERILEEREEREIKEQREREKREMKVMEQEEASRWPQQQEAITGHSDWLYEYYQFSCSSQVYLCHRCHNNSTVRDSEEAQSSYATHRKCSFCHCKQETTATVPEHWCTIPNANHKVSWFCQAVNSSLIFKWPEIKLSSMFNITRYSVTGAIENFQPLSVMISWIKVKLNFAPRFLTRGISRMTLSTWFTEYYQQLCRKVGHKYSALWTVF